MNLIQSLKRYRGLLSVVARQRREIRDYINNYVPAHADTFDGLKQFKDKHKGERVFIVATGPSLTTEDVEKLKGETCFIMNSGFRLIDKVPGFKPAYYAIGDGTVFARIHDDIDGSKLPTVFYNEKDIDWDIPGCVTYPLPVAVSIVMDGWQRRHLPRILNTKRMSYDISQCVYMGDTIVNIILQICFYMGFKEIYLIGTDCNYFGKDLHSNIVGYKNDHDLHTSPEEMYRGMIEDYTIARGYADASGVKIYNATRGGMLEVFPRVDLDEVLHVK